MLETVYEEVLFYCLTKRGLSVTRQMPVPVFFEDVRMDIGFRADLIVENKVIVELKSIDIIPPARTRN